MIPSTQLYPGHVIRSFFTSSPEFSMNLFVFLFSSAVENMPAILEFIFNGS